MAKVEYLRYILTRNGIKPQPEKFSAILALDAPKNIRELCAFLGMVQYYHDMWEKRSHLLAPLSDLVRKWDHTKGTRKSGVKKVPYHWDPIHQYNFNKIKEVIALETLLAYPNYDPSVGFDNHTGASTHQLGAVISQNQRPIAFFSRKLSEAQTKYSVTELELLSIVECLKEFKGTLWEQKIRVYADH